MATWAQGRSLHGIGPSPSACPKPHARRTQGAIMAGHMPRLAPGALGDGKALAQRPSSCKMHFSKTSPALARRMNF